MIIDWSLSPAAKNSTPPGCLFLSIASLFSLVPMFIFFCMLGLKLLGLISNETAEVLILLSFAPALVFVAFIGGPLSLTYLTPQFGDLLENGWIRAAALIWVLSSASLLYWLREVARPVYGTLELIVAIVLLWYGLGSIEHTSIIDFQIAAGVYFVVRALDNMELASAFKKWRETRVKYQEPLSKDDQEPPEAGSPYG